MIIHKINIIRFGKLKNFEMECHDALHIIRMDNGKGKTTILHFLRAMFYGMGRNQKRIDDSLRSKYLPWDENSCVGMIDFEQDGQCYHLERTFRKTPKDDHCVLFNSKTGEQISCEQEIGEVFFKMSEEEFLNTVFIRQKELIVYADKHLQDALINVIQTGNVATSYEKAIAFLKDIEKESSLSKINSPAWKIYKDKIKLEEELQELEQKNQQICSWMEQNEQLNQEKEMISEQINEYEQVRQYFEMKAEVQQKEQFRKLQQAYEDKEQEEDYDFLLQQAQQYMSIPSDIRNFGFEIIVMILLLIGSVTIALTFSYYWFLLLLLEIPIFIYLQKQQKKDREIKRKRKEECTAFFNRYQCHNFEEFTAYVSLKKAEQKIKQQKLNKNDRESEEEQSFFYDAKKECHPDYQEKLADLQKRFQEIERLMAMNQGKIDASESHPIQLQDQLCLIKDYEEKLTRYNAEYEAAILAKEVLKEAKEALQSDYLPMLKKEFLSVLNELTENHFLDLTIDSQMNVYLAEEDCLHALDFYSQGYKDLIYFSLRIALLTIGYNQSKIPLFLDDPFVNLDERNMKKVLDFIKKCSKQRQIFYFSCHDFDNFI